LVVVGFASAGERPAGLVSAASAALGFDFFLTRPYGQLSIASAHDMQTTLLLLLVGVAVTEIAYRRRRQQEVASARLGYLQGVESAATVAAQGSSSPSAFIEAVAAQITQVMGLARCRFDYGTGLDYPRLEADGNLLWRDQVWDVDNFGLPAGKDTELVVMSGGRFMGRFLLRAGPGAPPSVAQRQVAVALAAQAGAALGANHDARPSH
jgi:cbb3-type cytochrome oxidase subunit 3